MEAFSLVIPSLENMHCICGGPARFHGCSSGSESLTMHRSRCSCLIATVSLSMSKGCTSITEQREQNMHAYASRTIG